MKHRKILIALVFFALPIIGRLLWFYQGVYLGNPKENYPSFEDNAVLLPELSTPVPDNPTELNEKITILVDKSHRNLFTVAEIEPLFNDLILNGAEILIAETESDFESMLRKSDALLIITPSYSFTSVEIEDVEEFVYRGGKLVVIADPTRSYEEYQENREKIVIQTNQLLQPFLLSFNNDYIYNLSENEGNFRNVFVHPTGHSDLTRSLTSLVFYGSHSIGTSAESVIEGGQQTLSSLTDVGGNLPVAALDASGNVLIIGDLSFMTNPYYQVADNYKFIENITDFLIDSSRDRNFHDFPDIFTRDIGIILSEGITLDNDLLQVISDLQVRFAVNDYSVTILEESTDGFDEIILGLYPPDEELETLTDAIGFYYSEVEPTATSSPTPEEDLAEEDTDIQPEGPVNYFRVPEFGSIPAEGFGFLMTNNTRGKMQLLLLAENLENCINLLKLVENGSLDGCLVGKNIAVCEQDTWIYNDYSFDYEPTHDLGPDDEYLENGIEPETTPESTPEYTPSPVPTGTEQP